ncbi:MAG TPA: type II toxin-antitoxin system prevent-host-death family antitoxin [Phycisphaerae bacterium]|nr:type II toxin-antitoxin system prevent-host-death family antitoxin [Phycisphaerae bacterium]HOJ75298.1 type II toxin-antitoxin system prevent-host-death family antitoxin [Phycisphaerae bacterium]HOM53037.1 type II toxin-antitoxin system prevent-host-death family antitoxin [Phycisphaerae bacterium]HPP28200.1 type II toxin-antitoxin system prevent-host-death family antitoxin [Phycisphaerae bacterium]HPU27034.1 type II toxin-antitoxin system prevent-host-death family antitoxin [Phycisphaerae ba
MLVPDPASVIGAYDAKTRLSELLERVEKGEELIITRHGRPIAKLVPVRKSVTAEQRRAAIRRWRKTTTEIKLKGLKLQDLTAEGRL